MEHSWYSSVSYDHHFAVFLTKKKSPKQERECVCVFNARWFGKAYKSQNPICVKMDLK